MSTLRGGVAACLTLLAALAQAAELARGATLSASPNEPRVRIQPLALGEVGRDVVYTPIPPCRVFDTRPGFGGGGQLDLGTPRTFATQGSLSAQGGNAAGCGIPTRAAAVQLQMSPVFPTGFGWITGNAQGQPINPNAALFTYNTGDLNTTSIAIVLNQTNGQFTIQANNTGTELVGDAVGYFIAPSGGNGLRVIQTSGTFVDAPSVINGSAANSAGSLITQGATVAGGGKAGTDCALGGSGTTRACGNQASDSFATVGGGRSNHATDLGATIAGGLSNTAGGLFSAIAGGSFNSAANGASVGGGDNNIASGISSVIGGGSDNEASAQAATVAGGSLNTASGLAATVAGGQNNTASGTGGFAAGTRAQSIHNGAFVWGDTSAGNFSSAGVNTFNIRARGGVHVEQQSSVFFGAFTRQMINLWGSEYGIGVQPNTLYFRTDNNTPANTGGFSWFRGGAHADVANAAGTGGTELMRLALNGNLFVLGSVGNLSDRDAKDSFAQVDTRAILAKLAQMPILSWKYKSEQAGITHIGPTAQDFKRLFGLGANDTHIMTMDADGVALAAIQGLHRLVEEKDARINKLERANEALQRKLEAIEVRLGLR